MALKRTNREVGYRGQIGVNRGTGFAAMAQAQSQRADAFENIMDNIAGRTLEEIKIRGAEQGKKEAELYEFQTETKTYTDPITNQIKSIDVLKKITTPSAIRTRTSQEAFDKIIYNRLVDDYTTQITGIANQVANEAVRNNQPLQYFEDLVNAQLEPIYDSIRSTNVEQIIRSQADKIMLDQGSQVHEKYLNTKKSINDAQGERLYLREASEYTDRAIYGDLSSEEAKQINEQLYNDWKTSLDAGQSWAIEYDIMGQMSLIDGYTRLNESILADYIRLPNLLNADTETKRTVALNIKALETLIDVGNDITLYKVILDENGIYAGTEEKIFTFDDLPNNIPIEKLRTLVTRLDEQRVVLESDVADSIVKTDMATDGKRNLESNVIDFTYSQDKLNAIAEQDQSANWISDWEASQDQYRGNPFVLHQQGQEGAVVDALTYYYLTHGTLPLMPDGTGRLITTVAQETFGGININEKGVAQLENIGAMDYFQSDNRRKFNRVTQKYETVQFDPIGELFGDNSQVTANMRAFLNDYKDVPDTMANFVITYNSAERNEIPDDQLFRIAGFTSDEAMRAAVSNEIDDHPNKPEGMPDIGDYYVQRLLDGVLPYVASGRITNPETFKNVLASNIVNFYQQHEYTPYVEGSLPLSDGYYFIEKRFGLGDQKATYLKDGKLVTDVGWLEDHIKAKVLKESLQFQTDEQYAMIDPDDVIFGKTILLQPTLATGVFNIVYKPDDQQSFPLDSEDGTPLQIDLVSPVEIQGGLFPAVSKLNLRDLQTLTTSQNADYQRSRTIDLRTTYEPKRAKSFTEVYPDLDKPNGVQYDTKGYSAKDFFITDPNAYDVPYDDKIKEAIGKTVKLIQYPFVYIGQKLDQVFKIIPVGELDRDLTEKELIEFRNTGKLPDGFKLEEK